MRCPRLEVGWLGVVVGVLFATAQAPAQSGAAPANEPNFQTTYIAPATPFPGRVPLNQLTAPVRDQVRRVLEQPTIAASGPIEEFIGRPALYQWLLDHPDRASVAWRRLGVPALEITDRGSGRFGWTDNQGSDLHWEAICRTDELQVWYAEGRARPALLLPPVSVRAVVVLRHGERADEAGRTHIRQQADLYVQTDSKTAALATRLIGPSAPHLAEQCVTQLQMFFSALTGYLDRHPERSEVLLFGQRPLGWMPSTMGSQWRVAGAPRD